MDPGLLRWTWLVGSSAHLVKEIENRRGQLRHQGLTVMRPISAILTYVDILDLFRIVTKCAEEPVSWTELRRS